MVQREFHTVFHTCFIHVSYLNVVLRTYTWQYEFVIVYRRWKLGALVVEDLIKIIGFRELLIAKLMKQVGTKLKFMVLEAWLMESLIESFLLCSAACFRHCVSNMFHTCFIPQGF